MPCTVGCIFLINKIFQQQNIAADIGVAIISQIFLFSVVRLCREVKLLRLALLNKHTR